MVGRWGGEGWWGGGKVRDGGESEGEWGGWGGWRGGGGEEGSVG